MSTGSRSRGRPLLALLLVLGAWTGARAALWDTALSAVPNPETALPVDARNFAHRGLELAGFARLDWPSGPHSTPSDSVSQIAREPGFAGLQQDHRGAHSHFGAPTDRTIRWLPRRTTPPFGTASLAALLHPGAPKPPPALGAHAPGEPRHETIWATALAGEVPDAASSPSNAADPRSVSVRRWSGDAWLLARKDSKASLVAGPAPATYGASQAGAVLRYRLAPSSGRRPAAYVRATAALNGTREKEAAFGLSARPIAALPIVTAAELRVTDQVGGTDLRPAVVAITELAPLRLPLGMQAELYGQAGYVGGSFETAFIDGQMRLDRQVGQVSRYEFRAGAGIWGGAQKGASRLDVGPTATLGMPLGGSASARLAVDWRFRVTGDAEPESGPALTLSAGF